ncbi:MAG: hypothetical protein MUC59_16300, partial [Saprospiraceae bacterium]|nr:hypothetical protein [Saprospiraceae bacterium]
MKKNKLLFALVAFFALGLASTSQAQYDDVYYDPDKDSDSYYSSSSSNSDSYTSSRDNDNNDFDDDEYEYYDEYEDHDFYYTSRIRRFNRPYYGFGYFDPVYVDLAYYDP